MSCPHQNIDRHGYCIFCGAKVEPTESPHSNWNDPINPFDMAKAIKEKEEKDKNKNKQNNKEPMSNNTTESSKVMPPTDYKLTKCPKCQQASLFYSPISAMYECINLKCKIKGKTINEIEEKVKLSPDVKPEQERLIHNKTERERQINPQSPNSTNQQRIQTTPDSKKEQVSITSTGIEIRHEGRPIKGSAEVPSYVYLIIDCSSSMFGSKLQQAKKGASNFAREALTKNYLTGLIKFDSHAKLIFEPCKDISLIENRVATLEVGTTTNMAEAINLSCNLLNGLSGPKAIVVVTDGVPNSDGDPQSSLRAGEFAKSQQIDIIAIGTDDADQEFLKKLASRSQLGMKVSSEKLEQSITSSVKLLPGNRSPEIKK